MYNLNLSKNLKFVKKLLKYIDYYLCGHVWAQNCIMVKFEIGNQCEAINKRLFDIIIKVIIERNNFLNII